MRVRWPAGAPEGDDLELKGKNAFAIVLLLLGLLVVSFFMDAIGRLVFFTLIGGTMAMLVIFV